MEVDKGSPRKKKKKNQTSSPTWVAAQARLNNEFTEDRKYHNLMRWLLCAPFPFGVLGRMGNLTDFSPYFNNCLEWPTARSRQFPSLANKMYASLP